MSVDRLDCVLDGDFEPFASMEKSSDGAYVRYEDYEAVMADLKNMLELSWYITRTYATDEFADDRTNSTKTIKDLITKYNI